MPMFSQEFSIGSGKYKRTPYKHTRCPFSVSGRYSQPSGAWHTPKRLLQVSENRVSWYCDRKEHHQGGQILWPSTKKSRNCEKKPTLRKKRLPPCSIFPISRFQNGRQGFLIVKDTTPKSTLTLPTKPSMIIFDSKQNRPNLLRDFGRLFDVIFQWIVLYMKKLTIHHYGWVAIPSTVYSVKKRHNRLSWTRCGRIDVQSRYLNQIVRLSPFCRFFVIAIGSGTDRTEQKCKGCNRYTFCCL